MTTEAIVQARMGSTRLPGKVLKDLEGRSMLERVLLRLEGAETLDGVAVATSHAEHDDAIVEEAKRLGFPVHRGSEEDVLDRYYRTASDRGVDPVVRVTSDCPLVDPGVVDDVVRRYHEGQPSVDYASNALEPRTFPRGLDVEVFSYEALEVAWKESDDPDEREHVTPHIYGRPDTFELAPVNHDRDLSDHRWTVDERPDLEFVRRVYKHLDSGTAPWTEVLQVIENNPSLRKINADVRQKELGD